jgi:hypothetical protein
MDLIKTVKERKSVRAFKPDPVSKETIEETLKLATHAASAINLQPWEFTVVMGEERRRLSSTVFMTHVQASCRRNVTFGSFSDPAIFPKKELHRKWLIQ